MGNNNREKAAKTKEEVRPSAVRSSNSTGLNPPGGGEDAESATDWGTLVSVPTLEKKKKERKKKTSLRTQKRKLYDRDEVRI